MASRITSTGSTDGPKTPQDVILELSDILQEKAKHLQAIAGTSGSTSDTPSYPVTVQQSDGIT